ncbi:MAG: transporter substrate-binding domain-containing protein, partial [Christensenellaceae bacterium]|nr:transporter substrate-binding domain-containing protein [Christensenellaceae bacterium]
EEPLSVEQYALAITKGNEELLEVSNEVLGEMIESGEVDKLIQEHMELAAAVG